MAVLGRHYMIASDVLAELERLAARPTMAIEPWPVDPDDSTE
jgi:hypothetical protein